MARILEVVAGVAQAGRLRGPPGAAQRDDRWLGELPTRHLATHTFSLEEGARGYEIFKSNEDGCVRPVFLPRPGIGGRIGPWRATCWVASWRAAAPIP